MLRDVLMLFENGDIVFNSIRLKNFVVVVVVVPMLRRLNLVSCGFPVSQLHLMCETSVASPLATFVVGVLGCDLFTTISNTVRRLINLMVK